MTIDKILENLRLLSHLPLARQLGLFVGLSLTIALAAVMYMWAKTPDYTILYADLDTKAAAEVSGALDRLGEKYEVDQLSGLIKVPNDRVHQLRLRLAGQGLPSGGQGGFDILYEKQELGTSSFIETARYNRALEEELASSIATLDSIKSARVHLAIPKQSAFVRRKEKANASVLINLIPGSTLSENQMAGIVYMVASSVPSLEPEGVTLVDQRGRLLSNLATSQEMILSNEQHRFTREVETKYVGNIMDILAPILGQDGVRAQVAADLNFTQVSRTSEEYNPDRTAIRSEQMQSEMGMASGGMGSPGILEGQPDENEAGTTTAETVPRTQRETRNFEVDKTVSYITENAGTVNKLSVAVVVDYRNQMRADGTVERLPLTEQELEQIRTLVRDAVGFTEARGDTLSVTNAPFIEANAEFAEAVEAPLWQQPWVQTLGKQILAFIGVLILIFAFLRPLLKVFVAEGAANSRAAAQARLAPAGAMPGAEGGMDYGNDQFTLSDGQFQMPDYDRQLLGARNLVRDDPGRVAAIVKGWVAADG